MGLDLTLVVNNFTPDSLFPRGYERLMVDQDSRLFAVIREAPGLVRLRQGRKLYWYGEEGLRSIEEGIYGNRLTSIRAGQLATAMGPLDLGTKNNAVREYMKALPPLTEIFLWWN